MSASLYCTGIFQSAGLLIEARRFDCPADPPLRGVVAPPFLDFMHAEVDWAGGPESLLNYD